MSWDRDIDLVPAAAVWWQWQAWFGTIPDGPIPRVYRKHVTGTPNTQWQVNLLTNLLRWDKHFLYNLSSSISVFLILKHFKHYFFFSMHLAFKNSYIWIIYLQKRVQKDFKKLMRFVALYILKLCIYLLSLNWSFDTYIFFSGLFLYKYFCFQQLSATLFSC